MAHEKSSRRPLRPGGRRCTAARPSAAGARSPQRGSRSRAKRAGRVCRARRCGGARDGRSTCCPHAGQPRGARWSASGGRRPARRSRRRRAHPDRVIGSFPSAVLNRSAEDLPVTTSAVDPGFYTTRRDVNPAPAARQRRRAIRGLGAPAKPGALTVYRKFSSIGAGPPSRTAGMSAVLGHGLTGTAIGRLFVRC